MIEPVWDYKVLFVEFELMSDERMNVLGDDRWELVSVAVLPRERYQFVFRRPH